MEGCVTAEDIKLTDAVSAALREFGITVQEGDAPEPWFPNLLVKLINSTLREYQHSKIGLQKHTPMLAWACRNLLELDVLAKYVLNSDSSSTVCDAKWRQLVDSTQGDASRREILVSRRLSQIAENRSCYPQLSARMRIPGQAEQHSGASRTGFRAEAEQHSGVKPNRIPG